MSSIGVYVWGHQRDARHRRSPPGVDSRFWQGSPRGPEFDSTMTPLIVVALHESGPTNWRASIGFWMPPSVTKAVGGQVLNLRCQPRSLSDWDWGCRAPIALARSFEFPSRCRRPLSFCCNGGKPGKAFDPTNGNIATKQPKRSQQRFTTSGPARCRGEAAADHRAGPDQPARRSHGHWVSRGGSRIIGHGAVLCGLAMP